jgi:hypothetical protein
LNEKLVPFLADLDSWTTAGAASTYKKKTTNKLQHNQIKPNTQTFERDFAEIKKQSRRKRTLGVDFLLDLPI